MQAKPQEVGTDKATTLRGKSRTADKFVLRMPDGMRDRVEGLAETNHRSMNAEIIRRLERSFFTTDLVAQQNQLIAHLQATIDTLCKTAISEGAGPELRAAIDAVYAERRGEVPSEQ